MIKDKSDQASVDKVIAMGYPDNSDYLDELLSWTADPNWPIAASIFDYFESLGEKEVIHVLEVARKADEDWRYTLITQLITRYSDDTLKLCADHLKIWASQTGSQECDFESLRILSEREVIDRVEVAKIAKRNLFVYNLWIKETIEATEKSIYYNVPLNDHTL